jgi:hypothetical protein
MGTRPIAARSIVNGRIAPAMIAWPTMPPEPSVQWLWAVVPLVILAIWAGNSPKP